MPLCGVNAKFGNTMPKPTPAETRLLKVVVVGLRPQIYMSTRGQFEAGRGFGDCRLQSKALPLLWAQNSGLAWDWKHKFSQSRP